MSTSQNRLLINLRIVSSLLPHQKLNAKAELLCVEPISWWPEFVVRYWRGDGRETCLRRLEELVTEAITGVEQAGRLRDSKLQHKYLTHIYNCVPGFTNMKQTYANDATANASLELFIEKCKDVLATYNFEPDRLVVINDLPESDDSDATEEEEQETKKSVELRLGPRKGEEQWRAAVGRVMN